MYHAPIDALEQTAGSSEAEMEEGMKARMVWAEKCGDKLVDLGTPLANGVKLLYQGDPHLGWNPACEIEIHESMALPGS